MKFRAKSILLAVLFSTCAISGGYAADEATVKAIVDKAIQPVMDKYGIPGVAIGITVGGDTYTFNYGVASKTTWKPIDQSSLFELGSISKTFVVTMASLAQVNGHLSLSDKTSKFLPSMQGKPFGDVTLMHLATHTAGGFPLQVPDEIKNDDQLMTYFENWKPAYKAGTYRSYANPSIGMLGVITAKSMNSDFATLAEGTLFPALGLKNTYINVPKTQMSNYAQGYSKKTSQPA